MTNIKQLTMTLVALFAISAGAWAQETVFEYADPMVGTLTQGTTGTSATTVTINSESVNAIKFGNTYKYAEGKYITIAPSSGSFKKGDVVSIAGCIRNGNAESYAKAGIYTADGATQLYETANVVNAQLSTDAPVVETYTLTQDAEKLLIARSTGTTALYITTLKVVRTASAAAGIDLTPDATRKVWTLDKMPAGNVELQVEYYPGMLVKPTNLVGGTMEIEGLTDTTLPEGFEKDDDGNIYVKKDTKFTVKAVPAEGYHLVGWSDDATNKELEREFTMTDDDFILTATFSDEYDLAFEALNANTIEDGKATVKVGDTDKTATLIQDGKLSMKSGQTVTLTATTGYKFRSVEAKKAGAVMTTVTWNSTNVFNSAHEDVELSKWSPTPLSYEGITISFSGTKTSSFQAYDEDDHIGSLTCYGNNGDSFTFTAPSGKKFCKIEIINNGFIVFTNYGDWTRDADNKIVWSGTAANAVTLGSVYTDADNLNSIVFYLSE